MSVYASEAVVGRIYLSLPRDGHPGSKVRVLSSLQCPVCGAIKYADSPKAVPCKKSDCRGKLKEVKGGSFVPVLHCFSGNTLLLKKDYPLTETPDQTVDAFDKYGSPEPGKKITPTPKPTVKLRKGNKKPMLQIHGPSKLPVQKRPRAVAKRVAPDRLSRKRGRKFEDGDLGRLLRSGTMTIRELARRLKQTRASVHSQIYAAKDRGHKIVRVGPSVFKLVV